ncbi:GATA transcription factor 11-like [Gossypium australe]|uniref:GATA transcription factor 11-like n=1 Tax=Gossypium australe TaxID=47621 RepID=A0A5B6X715_9ROSI|nr:GATA transcription factor 11-like [Gossypium australe]
MSKSWFDKGYNGVGTNDDFFDDVIKYLDLPLEDVEGPDGNGSREDVNNFLLPVEENNDGGEDWDCDFENLEPPPTNVLASLSSGFYGDFFSDSLAQNLADSCDGSSQLNQLSSTTSITPRSDCTDVKGSTWFQTSSPVSVLESSSSCSAANPTPIDPKLSFLVKKRGRSKRRPASTFNRQFIFPSISSTSSASRETNYVVGSESESENNPTEKPAKKRQKKKKNLTLLSGCNETKKPPSLQPIVIMKCTHCEVTETPQWREGPMGPKTLCNACGVRYRSGRLFPEYRPAASPTFVASMHSNSHKKVVEMRKKAKLPLSSIPPKMSFRIHV